MLLGANPHRQDEPGCDLYPIDLKICFDLQVKGKFGMKLATEAQLPPPNGHFHAFVMWQRAMKI